MLRMGFLFSCSGVVLLALLLSDGLNPSDEIDGMAISRSSLPQVSPVGATVIKVRQEESELTFDVRVSSMRFAHEAVRQVASEHPQASAVRVHFYLPGLVMGIDPPTATFGKSRGGKVTEVD